jgi:hypothetical protein
MTEKLLRLETTLENGKTMSIRDSLKDCLTLERTGTRYSSLLAQDRALRPGLMHKSSLGRCRNKVY